MSLKRLLGVFGGRRAGFYFALVVLLLMICAVGYGVHAAMADKSLQDFLARPIAELKVGEAVVILWGAAILSSLGGR